MKELLTLLIFITTSLCCQGQQTEKFNLGFESQQHENSLSDGWVKWGSYETIIDSMTFSGKKAGKITSSEAGDAFGAIIYHIPANYAGKVIRLEGYMKIKNVDGGYAGLFLRVDGDGTALAFDNMESQNITGTKDWKKYSITLNYSDEAKAIYLGGILRGKGEAWFDDFVLTIDDKNVQTLKEVKQEVAKATLDREFDVGSKITISELTPQKIDNLELLGKVWGFLKYHHPEIAKGNYNWDYELFRFLPQYIAATNEQKRDRRLITWVDSIGTIEPCEKCISIDENAFLKPDLKWIEKQSNPLKERLRNIHRNRSQSTHYYIGMAPGVGNPVFKNENAYSDMPYPDEGFRLLSLYRYWNMINYFFPYKYLMDKDWDLTLKEYIPKFLNAKNELEYELAALQIIADIQDTHANLNDGGDKVEEWKGIYYPPIHVRFIENKLTVTDYYNPELKEQTGLELGDVITKINGKPVDEIIIEKSDYYPASNVPTRLRNLSADLLRANTEQLSISYTRGNSGERSKNLQLYPRDSLNIYRFYRRDNKKSFKILDNNIGYITLKSIKQEDIPEIKDQFKNTKGIIIDIRNYPSTFVPFSLGSFFVSSSTPFVKFTQGSIETPGQFTFRSGSEIKSQGETYKGKLVVLVNEITVSQAEYTAMAFRAGENSTIIGSTTAGADGNVSNIVLPGGLSTWISGIGVYYPNGEETQRIGIVPDVVVKPTVEGIRQNRDELLEKAIELILKE